MNVKIEKLTDPFIVCGGGTTGKTLPVPDRPFWRQGFSIRLTFARSTTFLLS
jgi:hypothetical protein